MEKPLGADRRSQLVEFKKEMKILTRTYRN